ncbi:hypothetical protein V8E36_006221 [Tilletia maclaganii]
MATSVTRSAAASQPSTTRAAAAVGSSTHAGPHSSASSPKGVLGSPSQSAANGLPSGNVSKAGATGDQGNSSLSGGQTAGAAIGAILGIFILVALLVWALKKYRRDKPQSRSTGSPQDWRGVTPIGLIRSASSRLGLRPSQGHQGWSGAEKEPLPEDRHAMINQYSLSPDVYPIGGPAFVNRQRNAQFNGHANNGFYDDDDAAAYAGAVPVTHHHSGSAGIAPVFEVLQAGDKYASASTAMSGRSQGGSAVHQRNSSLAKAGHNNRYDDDEYLSSAPKAPAMAATSPSASPRLGAAPLRYRYDPVLSGADDRSSSPALNGVGTFATVRGGSPMDAHDSFLGISGTSRPAEDQRRRMEEAQAMQVAAAATAGSSLRVAKQDTPAAYRQSAVSMYSTDSGAAGNALAPPGAGAASMRSSIGALSTPEMASHAPVFPAKTSVFDPYTHISRIYDPSIGDEIRRAMGDRPPTSMTRQEDGEETEAGPTSDSSLIFNRMLGSLERLQPGGGAGVLDGQPEYQDFYDARNPSTDTRTIATDSEDEQTSFDRDRHGAPFTQTYNQASPNYMAGNGIAEGSYSYEELDDRTIGQGQQRSSSRTDGTASASPVASPPFQITPAGSSNNSSRSPSVAKDHNGASPSSSGILGAPAPAWRAGAIAAAGVRRNRTSSTGGGIGPPPAVPPPPVKDHIYTAAGRLEQQQERDRKSSNSSAGAAAAASASPASRSKMLSGVSQMSAKSGQAHSIAGSTRSAAALAAAAKLQARQNERAGAAAAANVQQTRGALLKQRTGERWEDDDDEADDEVVSSVGGGTGRGRAGLYSDDDDDDVFADRRAAEGASSLPWA